MRHHLVSPTVRVLGAIGINALGSGFTMPFVVVYLYAVRDLPVELAGLAVTCGWLVAIAGSPLAGAAIDRFGARPVYVACCAAYALGATLLAVATSPLLAFVALAVTGVGQCADWSSVNAMLAGLGPDAERPRLYSWRMVLMNLGIGVGGAAAGLLADTGELRTFVVLFAADAASFVLAGALILATPAAGRREPPHPHTEEPGGWLDVLRDPRARWLIGVGFLVATMGYAQLLYGLSVFATEVTGVSTRALGFAFAASTVLIIALQFVVTRWLRGKRRTGAVAGFGVLLCLCWAMLGVAGVFDGTTATWLVIASATLFGGAETLWSPSFNTLIAAIAPPRLRGRYNAFSATAWGVAMATGPLLATVLIGAGLWGVYIGVIMAGTLAAAFAALRLRRLLTDEQDGLVSTPAPTAVAAMSTAD